MFIQNIRKRNQPLQESQKIETVHENKSNTAMAYSGPPLWNRNLGNKNERKVKCNKSSQYRTNNTKSNTSG